MRVFLIAAALVTVFYGRLFLGYTWYDQWDLAVQEIPRFDFLARTLQTTGRFPLWDPHLWAGQPVLGMPQPGPLYPLSAVLYLWPVDSTGHVPANALHVYYLLIHLQALLLAYGLCRALAAPPLGAWLGASLFTFGGVMGTSPWPDHLNGVAWAPGLAWMILRIHRGQRPWLSAALAGLMLGLSWLSGHHEAPFWLTLATAAGLLPKWRQLVLVAVVAALVAAPQALPSVDFGHRARRFVETGRPLAWDERVPYSIHARYSLSWPGLLGLVLPEMDPQAGNMALTGVVGVVLALLGGRYARLCILVAAFGVVLALGANTPFHGYLYDWVPMFDKARVPVRALFLTNLALAVLAALGSQRLRPKFQAACLAAALLELGWSSQTRITPPGAVQLAGWRSRHADLLAFLRQLPEPKRVMVDPAILPFNLGDSDGIDQIYGILPVVAANLEQHEIHTARVQDLLAVTHYVGGPQPAGTELFRSRSGVHVYARPHPGPRAWFASSALRLPDLTTLRARLQDPAFDLRGALTVNSDPRPTPPCPEARVISWRRPQPDSIQIKVQSPCPAWLILAERDDPGWSVRVDGVPSPRSPAHETLLGAAIPAGARLVEFLYR